MFHTDLIQWIGSQQLISEEWYNLPEGSLLVKPIRMNNWNQEQEWLGQLVCLCLPQVMEVSRLQRIIDAKCSSVCITVNSWNNRYVTNKLMCILGLNIKIISLAPILHDILVSDHQMHQNVPHIVTSVHIWTFFSTSIQSVAFSWNPLSLLTHWGNTFLYTHVQRAAVRSWCAVPPFSSGYSVMNCFSQQGAGNSHKIAASQSFSFPTNSVFFSVFPKCLLIHWNAFSISGSAAHYSLIAWGGREGVSGE